MADGELKQVIVIRRDLHMRRGKEIAQGAHAAMAFLVERYRRAGGFAGVALSEAEREWLEGGRSAKIVVQVPDEATLVSLHERARAAGLEAHLIEDRGLTEFGGIPTRTALAIGPDRAEAIDTITRGLALY
jgi:PTH2 family peptidyl-tRNA hydrolase